MKRPLSVQEGRLQSREDHVYAVCVGGRSIIRKTRDGGRGYVSWNKGHLVRDDVKGIDYKKKKKSESTRFKMN